MSDTPEALEGFTIQTIHIATCDHCGAKCDPDKQQAHAQRCIYRTGGLGKYGFAELAKEMNVYEYGSNEKRALLYLIKIYDGDHADRFEGVQIRLAKMIAERGFPKDARRFKNFETKGEFEIQESTDFATIRLCLSKYEGSENYLGEGVELKPTGKVIIPADASIPKLVETYYGWIKAQAFLSSTYEFRAGMSFHHKIRNDYVLTLKIIDSTTMINEDGYPCYRVQIIREGKNVPMRRARESVTLLGENNLTKLMRQLS